MNYATKPLLFFFLCSLGYRQTREEAELVCPGGSTLGDGEEEEEEEEGSFAGKPAPVLGK